MSEIKQNPEGDLFILGAGASKEAGLPLSSEMSKKIIENCRNSGDDQVFEALNFVYEGLKNQYSFESTDDSDIEPGIEAIYRILDFCEYSEESEYKFILKDCNAYIERHWSH